MNSNLGTNDAKLTTVEIASLWNSYIFESMVHHIFLYFSNNVDDKDIKTYIDFCRISSGQHVDAYKNIFEKENLPIPRGTTSEDINVNAPRLFSDKFYITYIKIKAGFALLNFTMAYAKSSRQDIRQIFRDHLIRLEEIDKFGTEIMVSKGIYNTPPQIDINNEVDFVERENFFAGFFGNKRPLTVQEISQLFLNVEANQLGKALMIGFSQVAKSKEVHDYVLKGRELSDKYAQMFSDKLKDEDISVPPSLDSDVIPVSSGQSPFSDRFILNHTVFLNSYGIGNYGLAISQSQRRDLAAMYVKVMAEVGLYADEGADLLMHNKWLEQPPTARGKKSLYHSK